MQTLQAGNAAYGPTGLVAAPHTSDALDTGPTVYLLRRGGRYEMTFGFHNSASVAVTITGVDHTLPGDGGSISGPTLRNASHDLEPLPGRFHPIRISPDGTGELTLVFHANARGPAEGARR